MINVTIPENNETASSQTYVTLTGLTCGRVYTLKALAFNSDGYSEMSDAHSFNIHSTFGVDCNGTNKAPVANAGEDQNITFGESTHTFTVTVTDDEDETASDSMK